MGEHRNAQCALRTHVSRSATAPWNTPGTKQRDTSRQMTHYRTVTAGWTRESRPAGGRLRRSLQSDDEGDISLLRVGNRMTTAGETSPGRRRRSKSFRQKDCCSTSLWRDSRNGSAEGESRKTGETLRQKDRGKIQQSRPPGRGCAYFSARFPFLHWPHHSFPDCSTMKNMR